MIQFNLLPDVKLEYIKAERVKRLVIGISTIAGVVALAIFVLLLLAVDGVQKKNLNDVNGDIKTASSKVQNTADLNKILTIQNQLSALTTLHDSKPAASRLFDYLSQVTPSAAAISTVTTDFNQHTLTISGTASNIDTINTFIDTLKFTNYTTDSISTPTKAFTGVVLTTFGRTDKSASYAINLNYDATIFTNTSTVKLIVPNTVTTRSVTEQPGALFKSTGVAK